MNENDTARFDFYGVCELAYRGCTTFGYKATDPYAWDVDHEDVKVVACIHCLERRGEEI